MGRKRAAQNDGTKSNKKPLLILDNENAAKNALVAEFELYVKRRLLDTKPEKLKTELMSKTKVPRGIVASIEQQCNWNAGNFGSKFRSLKNIDVWHEFIRTSFNNLASQVPAEVSSTSEKPSSSTVGVASSSSKPSSLRKEEIRSCHKSLTSILMPLIRNDNDLQSTIFATIKNTMQAVTQYSQDMAALVQASIIKFVTTPEADWYSSVPLPTKAIDLVPSFAWRENTILNDGYLPGLPPPDKPLASKLFDLRHIQHLKSCHYGRCQQSNANNLVWTSLDDDWTPGTISPLVTTSLQAIYNNKLETDLKNLFNGPSFKKMVRYVLRLLLRLHLAPLREQRYHAAKAKAANEKAKKIEAVYQSKQKQLKSKWNGVRNALRRQQWELQKKTEKIKLSDHQRQGYEARIGHLTKVLGSLKEDRERLKREDCDEQAEKDTSSSSKTSSGFAAEEASHNDVPDNEGDDVKEELDEMAVHDDLNSTGYELDEIVTDKSNDDISARRLGTLQGILTRMIYNENVSSLTEDVMKSYTKKLDLSDKESQALKLIYSNIKPFIISVDQPKYCRVNLLFFGNALLRLCGYHQFCMRYAPAVSTGSLYALSIDAAVIYELFGKPLDMKRSQGITSANEARRRKDQVFGCLFDMSAINSICQKNGIEFMHRMDISPANDASMQGQTVKPRQISLYAQRLKQEQSNPVPPSTPHSLDTLMTNIAEKEKERDRLSRTKRDCSNALMKHRQSMKNNDPAAQKFDDVKVERTLKNSLQQATRDVHSVQDGLANLRSTRYTLQKAEEEQAKKGKKKSKDKESPLPPTELKKTTRVEEDPRHTILKIDTNDLLISGTDYGVVTLATTVTHSVSDLEAIKAGQMVRLGKPTLITARDISWKTGQHQFNKKMKHDKAKSPSGQAAQQAETIVAENILSTAFNLETFQDRYDRIREQTPAIRAFYHQPKFERRRRLIAWRTKLVKTKIVHSIALITNEARTSMVCPYCRERIIHPRKLTMGKRKLNLGTSCCANPNCACYKECKNSFGRDTLSATCIALRAYGQLTKDPIF
ncbi:hypothetical protein DM01DRAFT_1332509 [Hesseltinella vesiculosa]|uniref:Uncharacterized protein n=1 Tax=Hesseltinella vesiculosa TaxID=101127 RepID=A0A1X2GSD1_9FUNG|nr:hypothetical protein DM01DRAFT_1332509 [Hesseltinella vesiculosa]